MIPRLQVSGPAALGCAGVVFGASSAAAHVLAPQYSVFDNGALHAIVNPGLLIPLLGLGVALGRGRHFAAGLSAVAWLMAFAAGAVLMPDRTKAMADIEVSFAFLAAGAVLLARDRSVTSATALAGAVIGFTAGALARRDDPSVGTSGWFTLGFCAGGSLVMVFAAQASVRYRPAWLAIPLRIGASWLLALGLMFLGLAVRPPPAVTRPAAGVEAAPLPPARGTTTR